jgi:hypothetical protein
LGEYIKSGKPVRLDRAFFSLSEDMIFEYDFGLTRSALDLESFAKHLYQIFIQAGSASKVGQACPIVPKVLNALPDWVVLKLQPGFWPLLQMKRVGARIKHNIIPMLTSFRFPSKSMKRSRILK